MSNLIKILAKKKKIFYNLRKKKIVLCHGAFDVIHPGHLKHLESAKKLGDILIVTITADKYLRKHLHSPLYSEKERLKFLKSLKIVDYAFIADSNTAIPSLKEFEPHYYCKGLEYKEKDDIGNLNIE